MTFEQKVEATIRKHNLIKNNDRVIIGVSGGADSVALLTVLRDIQHKFNMTIEVCHINHGLRPESVSEQGFVKHLCDAHGVKFHVKEVDCAALAKQWNMSIEEAGRKVRYDFFEEIAQGDKIATAHHMNDNVETALMRIIRGTGLKGLAGIPYQRDNIIRPLLDVSRKEIEEYLRDNYQRFVTDSSNLVDIYTRNKIRLNIIPQIEQTMNPNFVNTMANAISNFKDDADYFQMVVDESIDESCLIVGDVCNINKVKFLSYHKAIQKRMLQKLIYELIGFDVSSNLLENLVDGVTKTVGVKVDINQEYCLTIMRDDLVIQPNKTVKTDLSNIAVQLNSTMNIGNYRIKITEVNKKTPIQNTATVFYLPRELWTDRLSFRKRRNGDIVNVDHNISKKLGRFFTDKKVDNCMRDNYWLLTDGLFNIYWIPGLFGGRFNKRTGNFVKFEIL